MFRQIASSVGRHFMRRVVASNVQKASGGAIDPKFGLRLLRDSRVPTKSKLAALALGLGVIFVLNILELPLEAALAFLLPVIGVATDVAFNGFELLAGPLLIASITLQWIAPRDIVDKIRAESEGRVYEAAPIK